MAERRMFAKSIIDSDLFLDMPQSSQNLYFHLAMRADDEGFINNPKRIMRMISASDDDMKVLIAKRFVIIFESGIVVIRHWKIHNYLRSDRFKPTVYTEEKSQLFESENKEYCEISSCDTNGIPPVHQMDTQVSIGKYSVGKDSLVEGRKGKRTRSSPPSLEEITAYCRERRNTVNPESFFDYYEARGWKYGQGKPIVDWKAAVRTWEKREREREEQQNDPFKNLPNNRRQSFPHLPSAIDDCFDEHGNPI